MVVCFLITSVVRESRPDPEPWCCKLAADYLTVAGGSCGMKTDPHTLELVRYYSYLTEREAESQKS